MNKRIIAALSTCLILAACAETSSPSSGSPTIAASSPSVTARATGTAAATAAGKTIDVRVVSPEANAKAGIDGIGWTVDIVAKGSGSALDKVKPALQTSATTPGRNPAFPGLVVLLSTTPSTGGTQGPQQNLAKLFQITGLPDTTGGSATVVGGVQTSPAPTGTGAAASPTGSPAGTAATVTAGDNITATTTWLVQQAGFGSGVDAELTVFVVDGDAPDVVSDRASLKIVSNEVTVRFHINGSTSPSGTGAPAGTASPATSPSGSPAGTARPTATASPSGSP